MKRIYIYIAFISVFIFTSCDDFLDVKPKGKVIPTTYQDFREVLTYAYANLPIDRSTSTIRGDEVDLVIDFSDAYLRYYSIFVWEDATPDPLTNEYAWQQFYKAILQANQVIVNGVNPTDGTQTEIDQLRGEAYLMRAYMHFAIAEYYSDVYSEANRNKKSIPLATTIDIWKNYERNTIGEVYDQIFSDIDESLKLLNVDKQPTGINYRFSRVSAYGFAARVYAYAGNWGKAKEYAKLAYDIDNTLVDLNNTSAILPTVYTSPENVLAMEQTYYTELVTQFNISQKLIDTFDKTEDLRFAKYFTPNGSNYRCALGNKLDNKVSMRTAEFYLLLAAAEAKTTDGNLTQGKQYLKDLLVNRLTPAYYTTEAAAIDAMNNTDFIERVAEERFRELACQGFRWYDLKNFGKPRIEKTYQGNVYVLEQDDSRYVIPFPKEAISANPNLLN